MDVQEAYLRHVAQDLLTKNAEDIDYVSRRHNDSKRLQDLQTWLDKPFARMTYNEALEALRAAKNFNNTDVPPPKWGEELRHEHELFLTTDVRVV